MEKFKVKKKHLTGQIADFPKRVVQAMVDEQVRQGNPADPSVFWIKRSACKREGGFNWYESSLGWDAWVGIMSWKKFHLIPKREKPLEKPRCSDSTTRTEATPTEVLAEILQDALEEGYSKGQSEGYDEGYSDGKSILEGDVESAYNEGYALGYSEGHSEGYDEGYSEGYATGQSAGYASGYSEGHSEVITLLKMR